MPLAFDKRGEVGASTAKVFDSLRKSKHQTIHNKTCIQTKFLRKHDMHDMQHISRHLICMICIY